METIKFVFGRVILSGAVILGISAVSLWAAPRGAIQRGSLVISTNPDSALIVLDKASEPEKERTPYKNESMIPGKHQVHLESTNPFHKTADYEIQIEADQVTGIEHRFDYRSKTWGLEHMSLAPWKMSVQTGFAYQQHTGYLSGSGDSLPSELPSQIPQSEDYDSDSLPSSFQIPLTFRMGLPQRIEAFFTLPVAAHTDADGDYSGLAIGDVSLGAKWGYLPWNIGVFARWTLPSGNWAAEGLNHHVFSLGALGAYSFSGVDLLGNLSFEAHLDDETNSNLHYGERINLDLRAGYLLKDFILPNLGVYGSYWLDDEFRGESLDNSGYLLTLTPGVVLEGSGPLGFELGIPLRYLGANTQKGWGVTVSLSYLFSFERKAAKTTKNQKVEHLVEQAFTKPIQAQSFVLFDAREVSNAEYKEFCDKTGRNYPTDPGFNGVQDYFSNPDYADYPVVYVSLDDARAYAKWKDKRLPTVEEWKREMSSVSIQGQKVNCGSEMPMPVDAFGNAIGAYHLVGNVSEWVESSSTVGATAYHAGGFYQLPVDRCEDESRWIDIASPSGSKYIGFRLVSDIK